MKLSRRNLLRLLQLQDDRKQFAFCINSEIDRIASVQGCSSEAIAKIIWANAKKNIFSLMSSFIRLARLFSGKRLEAACKRVSFYGLDSIDIVKTVLMERLDLLPLDPKTDIYGQPELF